MSSVRSGLRLGYRVTLPAARAIRFLLQSGRAFRFGALIRRLGSLVLEAEPVGAGDDLLQPTNEDEATDMKRIA